MAHYLSVPQSTPLRVQQVPESFYNLRSETSPAPNVLTPVNQHTTQEKVVRQCIQILERVVHFKRATAEICVRIRGFTQEAREKPDFEVLDMVLTSNSMQERIITSLEMALETAQPDHDFSL